MKPSAPQHKYMYAIHRGSLGWMTFIKTFNCNYVDIQTVSFPMEITIIIMEQHKWEASA